MSDIELYDLSPNEYEDLQLRRPDYTYAVKSFNDLAVKYLENKKDIIIADFCCGTGKNTALLVQNLNIKKAILIDINKSFLEIAERRRINTEVYFMVGDILSVSIAKECGAVISMFAYHHVPDDKKMEYIDKVKSTLKNDGILLLGEIYVPDKETISRYYDRLISEIGPNSKQEELIKFLTETANSHNFEFKVSKDFANRQLIESGFELVESNKIWPKDNEFGDEVGTFVEVWKLIK